MTLAEQDPTAFGALMDRIFIKRPGHQLSPGDHLSIAAVEELVAKLPPRQRAMFYWLMCAERRFPTSVIKDVLTWSHEQLGDRPQLCNELGLYRLRGGDIHGAKQLWIRATQRDATFISPKVHLPGPGLSHPGPASCPTVSGHPYRASP